MLLWLGLSNSKIKAQEAGLKAQLIQFGTLMELEYATNKTYAGLSSPGWGSSEANASVSQVPCDTLYPLSSVSANVHTANAACKKIVDFTGPRQYSLYVKGTADKFSVQGWFSPNGLLYCVGSTGKSFGVPYDDYRGYSNPGCSESF